MTDAPELRAHAVSPSEQLRASESALYSSARLMEEYQFLRRQGWHSHWSPDGAVRRSEEAARRLVWC